MLGSLWSAEACSRALVQPAYLVPPGKGISSVRCGAGFFYTGAAHSEH